MDRLASVIGDNFDKGKAAAAILLTQPFPPIVYYGDEIGMRGFKNGSYTGDAADIPMREPFKWNAVAGPPMSNYFVLNSAAYNNRYEQNNDGRSVAEQQGVSGSLLEAYRALIAARKNSVALRRGSYNPVVASDNRIWAFLRYDAAQQVLVLINVSGDPVSFTLDFTGSVIAGGSTVPTDVITSQTLTALTTANQSAYPASLGAYQYNALEVQVTPPPPPLPDVDGRDIPTDFGPAALVATQDNATALGDNVGELNQLYVVPETDVLRIGITGNVADDGMGLALFLDTVSGGQSTLDLSNTAPPPAGPDDLTGLRFDDGFVPDHMIFANAYQGTIYVDQYQLLTSGGVSKTYRGQGTVNDGDGYLYGGSNSHDMQIALDNTNTLGITDTDVSAADTATTGFEMLVPYEDIGLLPGADTNVGIAAFLLLTDGTVTNQWLPGLGGGYSINLGLAPNMKLVPGTQYAVLALDHTGDLNCDGLINNFDIDPFALAVASAPSGYSTYYAAYPNCDPTRADIDGSGVVDLFDIDPFVDLLIAK